MDKSYLIIGGCGVGKTHVMKQLIQVYHLKYTEQYGLYHYVHNFESYLDTDLPAIAILGKYDGTVFEGSDRLAMNIMADNEKVKDTLKQFDTVIAEGDRFTNQTYINFFKPTVLRIRGTGAEGRAKRGTTQTERHIKSMNTRVNNIIPNFEFANSQDCFNFITNELQRGPRTAEPYKSPNLTLF